MCNRRAILRYVIAHKLRHMCWICISKKLKYLKNEAERNQKLKDNLLCYFKCSFKYDKLDFLFCRRQKHINIFDSNFTSVFFSFCLCLKLLSLHNGTAYLTDGLNYIFLTRGIGELRAQVYLFLNYPP